ncbi:hypothetical protein [Pelomonas sp. BJYL3]|uniref:hypothetical protein n=1 Tax=Pelomonas sp. BJYL3 TaxID=2976697 RepID=UPI0022B54554|nr:hypothetical protein [Pelomonas sp. BJYL3]
MTALSRAWQQLRQQKLDKRVLWLLAAGALTVAGELSLRAWDAHQKLAAELKTVRGRVQLLQSSADKIDWAQRTQALGAAHEALQGQLWHAPSEAQGQAMLRDWLSSVLKDESLKRVSIALQPPVAAAASALNPDKDKDASPAQAGKGLRLAMQAIRVRATVTFELAPGAMETALQRIERGGQLASVDTLTASRRSRRVELTVSLPVIVDAAPSGASQKP